MISAVVAGNLGRDAEVKNVGGTNVTSFSVASSQKIKGEDKTVWVSCNYWGKAGEAVSKYLQKGKSVVASGSLSTREHDGKTYLELRVDNLKLMGGDRAAGGGNSGGGSSKPASSKSDFGDAGFGGGDDDDNVPF
jgi:single-strand DNA-binding protein